MQYILSQKEYDDLKQKKDSLEDHDREELQKLCTHIANSMPILFWDREEPTPWGCAITFLNHYCDECPVQSICPREYKSWSQ
jgi:hypothetical protein